MSESILRAMQLSRDILERQIETTLQHFRQELDNNGPSKLAETLWSHAYALNQLRRPEPGCPGLPGELVAFPAPPQTPNSPGKAPDSL